MNRLIVLITLLILAHPESMARHSATDRTPSPEEREALKLFLRQFGPRGLQNSHAKYQEAFVALEDNGDLDVLVYLSGSAWCGTGGCTLLILQRSGGSYRLVSKIPTVRLPVGVLDSKSNGWKDISIWVQGGGILNGYTAKLSFDGTSYPASPSTPPAVRFSGNIGRVVISQKDTARSLR